MIALLRALTLSQCYVAKLFSFFGHSLTIEIILAIQEDYVKNSEEDLAGGRNCIECCDLLLQHWQEQG